MPKLPALSSLVKTAPPASTGKTGSRHITSAKRQAKKTLRCIPTSSIEASIGDPLFRANQLNPPRVVILSAADHVKRDLRSRRICIFGTFTVQLLRHRRNTMNEGFVV